MRQRAIVELDKPVLRGRTQYAAGHQFEVLVSTPTQHICRDKEGRRVVLGRCLVRVVREAIPDVIEVFSLDGLVDADVVRPASALVPGGAA